jgi:hypothetical protein
VKLDERRETKDERRKTRECVILSKAKDILIRHCEGVARGNPWRVFANGLG